MRGRANLGVLAAAAAGLAVLAAGLGRPPAGSAMLMDAGGGTDPPSASVRLDQSARTALVLRTAAYRMTISKRNGAIVDLRDAATGTRLVTGTNGCEWGTSGTGSGYSGGFL